MKQEQAVTVLETELIDEQYVLFGPIKPNKYPAYAQEKIIAKYGPLSNSEKRQQRLEMWQKYEKLLDFLISNEPGGTTVLELIQQFIKDSSGFAKKQLEETPPGGLGIHLKEVHEFAKSLLLTPDAKSRFAELITDRDAQLMCYVVADMHDILKFLGSMEAQIMPDHEVMTAELILRTFVNKKVTLAGGNEETLTIEDVEFVAGVVGDHENIEKEEGRSDFINQGIIERAKAIFFVLDVLTGVLKSTETQIDQEGGIFQIDLDQLWTRFGDLYVRHMDPVKGKIFRPEWGAYTFKDLLTTIATLRVQGLMIIPAEGAQPSATETIRAMLLTAIDQVLGANEAYKLSGGKFLDDDQVERVKLARSSIAGEKFL